MKRNRIVIDLDKPAQPRKQTSFGRGVGRVLLVIAGTLVLIVVAAFVGAFIWWRTYQKSPTYSLAVLTDAAQREDAATIDTILDADKVTDDFVSQARQRTVGSYSAAIGSLLINGNAANALSPKLKQTVHDQVVREIQRITQRAAGKPFILIALAAPRFVEVKQEDETARVLVNMKDEAVRLTMQPADNHWRIVAIQDDRLAQLIADGIKRNLAGSVTK